MTSDSVYEVLWNGNFLCGVSKVLMAWILRFSHNQGIHKRHIIIIQMYTLFLFKVKIVKDKQNLVLLQKV